MDAVAARLSWRRLPWLAEIALVLGCYALYCVVRVLAPHRLDVAFQNATHVASLESALGLDDEAWLNAFLTRHDWLEVVASYYYVSLHYVVTTAVLVWLWRRRDHDYAAMRSALVLASAAALVIYAAWPMAPPRYAMAGAVDTVSDVLQSGGHGVAGLVNDIAAMPSMHVGWALWCAVVVVRTSTHRLRHLAWAYPVVTTLVVVATANHYLLDAVGGVVVVVVPLYLCGAWRSRQVVAPARGEHGARGVLRRLRRPPGGSNDRFGRSCHGARARADSADRRHWGTTMDRPMQRYVLASHTDEQFRAIAEYVAQHQPGDGLRAAVPLEDPDGEHTHLYAIQGADEVRVDGHTRSYLTGDPSGGPHTAVTLDLCTSEPCERIREAFGKVTPVQLPPYDFYAFLLVHLEPWLAEDFVLPDLRGERACLPTGGGRLLLVQVAAEEREVVDADIEAWRAHPGVTSVRALRSSGRHLVRSPHR